MLRTRVISAVVLLALVAVPTVLGGAPFFLLIAVAGGLAAWEYVTLLRQGGYRPLLPVSILVTLLLVARASWQGVLPLDLVVTVVVAGSLLVTLWHQQPNPVTDWALSLAGALYLGLLLGNVVLLRDLDRGLPWLVTGAGAVFAADIGAYFAGRAWGRHPWWPRHSPKKTWEGYGAGVAAAALVALGLGVWLIGLRPLEALSLGLLIGAVAPLGDLAESMLKRQVGAKDSSQLIPGHGGVLDRIDSLLIALPLVYFWATLLPRWPA